MFISRRKYKELVKRVEALERKVADKSERLHNREVMSDADKIVLYLSKETLPPLNL